MMFWPSDNTGEHQDKHEMPLRTNIGEIHAEQFRFKMPFGF